MDSAAKGPRFQDIPQLTHNGHYRVNIGWDYLEHWLADHQEHDPKLDLDPDFQRGYVWTPEQKTAYVEYILRGGQSGRYLYFNCPSWMEIGRKNPRKYNDFVIVDGKQRLSAVLGFLHDEVPAFGHKFSDFEERMRITGPDFVVHVNNLATRTQVLQWYIEMNTGGTVHTNEEIARVKALLETARG